jgi:hypothetical protein
MNKRLVGMFTLSHKVAAYIPATINVNEEIDNTPYVEEMASIMSKEFGGATSTPANGFWMSESMGLIKEKTTIVFAYAESIENLDPIVDYLLKLKEELNQEAMAIEIDGKMYFLK